MRISTFFAFYLLLSWSLAASDIATTNSAVLEQRAVLTMHNLETHKTLLQKNYAQPTKVGFDFDDTLVFSSPAFIAADAQVKTEKGSSVLNAYLFHQVTNTFDQALTVAKKVGMDLIALHSQRHDDIYIITARIADRTSANDQSSSEAQLRQNQESMAATFNKLFRNVLKKPLPPDNFIFTGRYNYAQNKSIYLPKSDAIKATGVQLFYGDADSDIAAAVNAHVQPIRILRSAASTYKASYNNIGKVYKEWVIADSDT